MTIDATQAYKSYVGFMKSHMKGQTHYICKKNEARKLTYFFHF